MKRLSNNRNAVYKAPTIELVDISPEANYVLSDLNKQPIFEEEFDD